MSSKERLHRLVDELPDSELPTAERVLDALRVSADPVTRTLDNAPLDDEPDLDDADGGPAPRSPSRTRKPAAGC